MKTKFLLNYNYVKKIMKFLQYSFFNENLKFNIKILKVAYLDP